MPMTPAGYVPVTPEESLTDVQDVFKSTFGNSYNLTPTTVNGVFIQELTNIVIESESAKTLLYSGLYNPNIASGSFLDSIGKLTNTDRKPATSSQVQCLVTGLPGVVIPANSSILNTNGDYFQNPNAITIPGGGSITAEFDSVVKGPIPCSAGTLTRIVQQISGWDTVTNVADGILGKIQQTDTEFRYTRNLSLAVNSSGSLEAINTACQQEDTIADFYCAENYSPVAQTIKGVSVGAHSICLSVYGGTDAVAGTILFKKKSAGCGMSGNTTYTYTDSTYNWVVEDMIFQRAVEAPTQVNVVLSSAGTYPSDVEDQVQAAVVANFRGEFPGVSRVRMGVEYFASRFYQSLSAIGINTVTSITVGLVGGPYDNSLELPITQAPTLIAANVVVTIV